ncbi:uncharacterized protein DEA37_0001245 [Paragonimus westermani]|uniref:Uncharacterized protein n=1 Tax=Paragonimus westermani TaxID=34504 RepID=A0A5J4N6B5_9TREM|nr:uncharacterized protein DEA37_0001245 [Paragonimus westermani]
MKRSQLKSTYFSDDVIVRRKLCEKYVIDAVKYFGGENSYGAAVNDFLRVTQLVVDTESLISGSYELQANGEFKHAIEDEKKRIKRWKHDRDKLTSEMKSQIRIIDEEIKRYRDKFRDMIRANEDYSRIEADKTHSQMEVDKAGVIALSFRL